jgi:hypothetical protein
MVPCKWFVSSLSFFFCGVRTREHGASFSGRRKAGTSSTHRRASGCRCRRDRSVLPSEGRPWSSLLILGFCLAQVSRGCLSDGGNVVFWGQWLKDVGRSADYILHVWLMSKLIMFLRAMIDWKFTQCYRYYPFFKHYNSLLQIGLCKRIIYVATNIWNWE